MDKKQAAKLGSKGLINSHEFVRIIIECLDSLGYSESAACLESESGIALKSEEFEALESYILSANWDECLTCINKFENLNDETRASALFYVLNQCLLECLNSGDDSLALTTLRKKVNELQVTEDKVHQLAFGLLSLKGLELSNIDDNSIEKLRKRLLKDLEKVLPPPLTLPKKRLEHLIETAVCSQVDNCVYHSSYESISLYEDHHCDRDQFPTQTIQILTDHKNEVWFVQFSNNGEYLASSSSDCTAIIWKVIDNNKVTHLHTLKGHENPVSFVSWSPNDRMLLTCGNMEVVKLWDIETGTCIRTYGDEKFIISSCAWFPDSKRFVCGSLEPGKGIYMWDIEGNEIKAWKGIRMPKVSDLAITPNGENLISIFSDKEIRILNMGNNSERVISEVHPITSLSVSTNSKSLIVNLNSQEIHMWDITGKLLKPVKYKGHRQHKYVIRSCFGGVNCRFIASGSEDSKVYLWNERSSHPLEILCGHLSTVNSVSWNPKKPQMLASASDDQTIRIWGPCNCK